MVAETLVVDGDIIYKGYPLVPSGRRLEVDKATLEGTDEITRQLMDKNKSMQDQIDALQAIQAKTEATLQDTRAIFKAALQAETKALRAEIKTLRDERGISNEPHKNWSS